ncbi:MAG TPA: DUF4160 domain-containing protein [Steroidobacteraceae bacterium]|nr:DUF4160 domain-containing protein [Steroidobacteraceae bacterium]
MPVISVFSGIVIRMYFFDTQQHARAHVHAQYGELSAVFAIDDGSVLTGNIPPRQTRLIQAWIELRREDLTANWKLATAGAALSPIEPLR